jgi:hypothetical protein
MMITTSSMACPEIQYSMKMVLYLVPFSAIGESSFAAHTTAIYLFSVCGTMIVACCLWPAIGICIKELIKPDWNPIECLQQRS